MMGRITSWDEVDGLIAPEDGGPTVHVHFADMPRSIRAPHKAACVVSIDKSGEENAGRNSYVA